MSEPTLYQEPKDCQHRRAKLGIPPTCVECEAEMHWVVPVELDYAAADREMMEQLRIGPFNIHAIVDAALEIGGDDDE